MTNGHAPIVPPGSWPVHGGRQQAETDQPKDIKLCVRVSHPGAPGWVLAASPARRRRRQVIALLSTGAAVFLLAGCGSPGVTGSASAAASGSATPAVREVEGRVGDLVLGDGYIPEPASPDVAAAYLTIANAGRAPARLTTVRSNLAATVMPMSETTSNGAGSMAPLDAVVVPAHGSFRFHPGAAHLMLEHPQPVPPAGGDVSLTFSFIPGGTVTVSLPVIAIGSRPPSGGAIG